MDESGEENTANEVVMMRERALRLVETRGHVDAILCGRKAVFCRAEHERFVEDTNAPKLDLEFLYPGG